MSAQNVAKTIVDGLDYWANQFPQEKVFIQTDKKQILQGEDVWFKAWCTYNGKPTFLSRILYVDMVDKNGVVVQKKMYRLDSSGSANGFINIDNKIASGTYSINCYTHWMLNFPGFIAKETLQVMGLENTNPNTIVAAGKIKTMMFFPEGGELIGGIQNRVAFKILDQAGRPVACSGKIKDQNDRAVADFMTEHDGMGVFQIEPELNNQYKAEITDANGATLYFTLPKQKDEGVTFMVQNTKSRLFAIVNRAEKK